MKKNKKVKIWQTSRRVFEISDRTLVMAILNVTPDSFSDGGKFQTIDRALYQAERLIVEGADILDIGGESTRPKSKRVQVEEEIERTAPVIKEISKRFGIPVSIDTSKGEVAEAAVQAGAEIINDVSGLKFDENIARVAAKYKAGLVLMHLRGDFETMHRQMPVKNILAEVTGGLRRSIQKAAESGIKKKQICLDIGIGFSKTFEQNLELLARLDSFSKNFEEFPILVGTSRKSFIGKILNDRPPDQRLFGTLAANLIAIGKGANIIRVHDVRAHQEAIQVMGEILKYQ
jgi:dihydropteroate synthase